MRPLVHKLKPSRGFSHGIYILFNILLPGLVLVLARASFIPVAIAVILLSKWRMFAVRPRFWLANIRTNAVDLIIGLSTLALMVGTDTSWLRIFYAGAWAVWLIFIKPRHDVLWISLQAFFGLGVGLTAVFSALDHASLMLLVAAVGMICFFTAHHFFYSFDEEHMRLLSYIWAYFGAALTWILGHWLVYYYALVAQPTLILVATAFSLGALYYLDHFDKLSKPVRRQIVFILITILLVIVSFSDWSDKTI